MKQLVFKAYENDLCMRVHTIGDQAIHKMIDFYNETIKIYGKKIYLHNTLEHLENFQEEDIERLSNSKIVASVQPAHAVYDPKGVLNDLGKDRVKLMWPFNSLLDKGNILAFGTDSPVVEVNPFINIYNAVTRKSSYNSKQDVFFKNECISIYEALKAYTYGSAYAASCEDIYGTLDINKSADICVLNKNLLNLKNEEDILNTKCLMTMVNGKIVYVL